MSCRNLRKSVNKTWYCGVFVIRLLIGKKGGSRLGSLNELPFNSTSPPHIFLGVTLLSTLYRGSDNKNALSCLMWPIGVSCLKSG